MPKKIFIYIVIPVWFFCFFTVNFAAAQTLLNETKNIKYPETCSAKDDACKQYRGEYGLNDFSELVVKISVIILGLVGSLALLAFVAGGFMLLVSGGNKNSVERGKATLIGAVIGLAVVFLSYTIISLVFKSLGVDANPFQSNWFPG